MDRLSYKGKVITFYEYLRESDFERDVIERSKEIFGQMKKEWGVRSCNITNR